MKKFLNFSVFMAVFAISALFVACQKDEKALTQTLPAEKYQKEVVVKDLASASEFTFEVKTNDLALFNAFDASSMGAAFRPTDYVEPTDAHDGSNAPDEDEATNGTPISELW